MSELTLDEMSQRGAQYLEHYGRKGMKWGQRIFTDPAARVRSAASSEKAQKVRAVAKKAGPPLAFAGAGATAALLVGPLGSMAVSAAKVAFDVTSSPDLNWTELKTRTVVSGSLTDASVHREIVRS